MGRYVYVVDADFEINVFSNRKKAFAYVDSMIEVYIEDEWRLKKDTRDFLDFLLRYVELTKRGRNNGTQIFRIFKQGLK